MSKQSYIDLLSDEAVRLCESAKQGSRKYWTKRLHDTIKEISDRWERSRKWLTPWKRSLTWDQVVSILESGKCSRYDWDRYLYCRGGNSEVQFFKKIKQAAEAAQWIHLSVEDYDTLVSWSKHNHEE